MSLYLFGAITRHAVFKNADDWEIFDNHQDLLAKTAAEFGLHCSRERINEDNIAFVIANRSSYGAGICVYDGECFEENLGIAPDDTFASRAQALIDKLNASNDLPAEFKDLDWAAAAARTYVSS